MPVTLKESPVLRKARYTCLDDFKCACVVMWKAGEKGETPAQHVIENPSLALALGYDLPHIRSKARDILYPVWVVEINPPDLLKNEWGEVAP